MFNFSTFKILTKYNNIISYENEIKSNFNTKLFFLIVRHLFEYQFTALN